MMKVEYKRKYIKTTSVLCSAKFWIYLISIILLVLIVAPIIRAASCGVLNADDFLMMNTVLKAEGYSGFSKAFANMKYYYNEWSGSYAVYFIEAFLAYLISLHNRLVPIYLAGAIILFICLYAILASLMCEHAGTGKVTAFWIFVGTIIPFFGFNYYTEVFYWFVGNCAYCMSFIVGFAELILLLLSDKYKSKILLCLSILTAVAMGGMWIQVMGVFCMLLFLLILYDFYGQRKINVGACLVFATTVIAGVIAVSAPGNYVRHSVVDSTGTHPLICLMDAFVTALQELIVYVSNPYLILFMLLLFYLGAREQKIRTDGKKLILIIATIVVLCMVTCYPVLLGYSTSLIESMPNRCMFVFDFVTCICWLIIAFELGIYLRTKGLIAERERLKLIIGLAGMLVAMTQASHMIYTASWVTLSQLDNGSIQQYSSEMDKMYDSIKNSRDENMLVYYVPTCPSSFRGQGISEDVNDWNNKAIAEYYHKASLRYIPSKN